MNVGNVLGINDGLVLGILLGMVENDGNALGTDVGLRDGTILGTNDGE